MLCGNGTIQARLMAFILAAWVSGHAFGQAPPSVREGMNLGPFPTMPRLPTANPADQSTSVQSGATSQPAVDKNSYQWSREDLAYLAKPGLWKISGRISAGWWYDDNIYLTQTGNSQTQKTGSGYYNLRPSFDVTYGPNDWGLACAISYDMDFQWYDDSKVDNTFNQGVGLQVSWTGARTRIYASTAYSSVDGGNVDIGSRVQQNDMYLNSGITYDLSAKVSIGLSFGTELLDYSGDFFSSNSYTIGAFADYHITPKTSVGLGSSYGFTEVEGGVNYNTYGVDLRFNWAATGRLSVSATGGVQDIESTQGDFSDVTPTATLTINYDIFGNGKTSAGLNFYRSYHPSALLQNQAYWANGVALNLSQQVAERTQVAVALGYEFASYTATAADIVATRRDNYYYIRPNVTYALSNRISCSIFYQFSKDDSTGFGSASFERNEVGVMLNYAF